VALIVAACTFFVAGSCVMFVQLHSRAWALASVLCLLLSSVDAFVLLAANSVVYVAVMLKQELVGWELCACCLIALVQPVFPVATNCLWNHAVDDCTTLGWVVEDGLL
jgi:hypothetical protein